MRTHARKCLPLLMAAALAASATVPARADSAVDAFVAQINQTVGGLKAGDKAGARAACGKLVRQTFDLGAMAPLAAGTAWSRMSASQKSAYRSGLERRAISDCVARRDEIAGQTLQLAGVRTGDGGDRFVAVRGNGRTLIWRVRGGGRLRAIDVSVNGRSLLSAAQRDAKAALQSSGGDLEAVVKSVGG